MLVVVFFLFPSRSLPRTRCSALSLLGLWVVFGFKACHHWRFSALSARTRCRHPLSFHLARIVLCVGSLCATLGVCLATCQLIVRGTNSISYFASVCFAKARAAYLCMQSECVVTHSCMCVLLDWPPNVQSGARLGRLQLRIIISCTCEQDNGPSGPQNRACATVIYW